MSEFEARVEAVSNLGIDWCAPEHDNQLHHPAAEVERLEAL